LLEKGFCANDQRDVTVVIGNKLKPSFIVGVVRIAELSDSLVLASFNVLLAALGFSLFATSYAILFVAVFWCALPVGLLLNLGFWVRDMKSKAHRAHAKIAVLVLMPLIAYEVWLLSLPRLDF
jgi:hypothetical protein